MTVDLKAIQDKRTGDMQRLTNLLESGKTPDEAIVRKTIDKIIKAQDKLIANGIDVQDLINEQGEIIEPESKDEDVVVNEVKAESTTETDTTVTKDKRKRVSAKQKAELDKPVPKKEFSKNEKVVKATKFGSSVQTDILAKVNVLAEQSEKKPNTVVVELLESLFDDGKFNVKFENKQDLKVTSYNLPTPMVEAINKINKETKLPKAEIFNKLLEVALKEYF